MAYVPPHRRGKQQPEHASSKDGETSQGDRPPDTSKISRWADGVKDTNSPAAASRTATTTRPTTRFESSSSSSSSSSSASKYSKTHRQDNSSTEDLDILDKAFHRVCCINLDARVDKWKLMQRDADKVAQSFQQRMERVSAVEGNKLPFQCEGNKEDAVRSTVGNNSCDSKNVLPASIMDDVCLEWDGTMDAKYNRRHGRPGMRTMTPSEHRRRTITMRKQLLTSTLQC
jgi:hypothetical protein